MNRPSPRLFHLHFNTPDVDAVETALSDAGFPLHRRFGRIDDDFVALTPDDPIPSGWRFHLETLQRGYVNVTLGRGTRFRFDHLGLYTRGFDAAIDRAEHTGWPVRDPEGRRPFVMTPWRFRIEIHPEGDDVERELGDWSTAHLEEVTLVVSDGGGVRRGLETVIGSVPGLMIRSGDVDRARVTSFTVVGDAFPDAVTVDVPSLVEATA